MKFWPVQDPSIIGRASLYSMWLASLGLKEIATKLAEILTGKAENLYEILRVDIIKGNYGSLYPSVICAFLFRIICGFSSVVYLICASILVLVYN